MSPLMTAVKACLAFASLLPRTLHATAAPLDIRQQECSTIPAKTRCSIDTLSKVLVPGPSDIFSSATITAASANDGLLDGTSISDYCSVAVDIKAPGSNNIVKFALALPSECHWNKRFIAVGNGGFIGAINTEDIRVAAARGFAAVSTDTGHVGGGNNLTWAQDTDALLDWSVRAMDMTVTAAKRITLGFYATEKNQMRSYYTGCSTGGRQGLKQIQLRPDSFDGVLVGAPAWDTKHLMSWVAKMGSLNLDPDPSKSLGPTQFTILANFVATQCDSLDGANDFVVGAPEKCSPDLDALLCSEDRSSNCLTAEQLTVAKGMYGDYKVGDQFIYDGYSPGVEREMGIYVLDQFGARGGMDYFKKLIDRSGVPPGDIPSWDVYDDKMALLADIQDPGTPTADSFDISSFRNRGGKIIMYHGLADGLIPYTSSEHYYSKTEAAMGGTANVESFFKFFEIPGMPHCYTTPAVFFAGNPAWYIGGAAQVAAMKAANVPAVQNYGVPSHTGITNDILDALVNWVEGDGEGSIGKGAAPEKIVAASFGLGGEVFQTKPLCQFRKRPVPVGDGVDLTKEENWKCEHVQTAY